MSKTKLFSLGEYDLRFAGFFLDEDENVWAEVLGETYPLQFDDVDNQFRDYYSFFGKKLIQFPEQSPEILGELFLDKLFSSIVWHDFIDDEEEEEQKFDSCSGFFMVIHAEKETEVDKDIETVSERFFIDGVFTTIEDAFDFMDEISREYPDIEFVVLSSLGSVKRNTTWSTHDQ